MLGLEYAIPFKVELLFYADRSQSAGSFCFLFELKKGVYELRGGLFCGITYSIKSVVQRGKDEMGAEKLR